MRANETQVEHFSGTQRDDFLKKMKQKMNKLPTHSDAISKKKKILELLSQGLDLSSACSRASIGRTSVWRWRQADPVFDQAILKLVAARRQSQKLTSEKTDEYLPFGPEINLRESSGQPTFVYPKVDQEPAQQETNEPGDRVVEIMEVNDRIKRNRISEIQAERRRKEREEFDPMRYGLGERKTRNSYRLDPLRFHL